MALQTFSNLESLLSIRTKINANFTELYATVAALAALVGTGGVTGSGLTVLQTSPTLITPTIGVARATSVTMGSGGSLVLYNSADEVTNFEVFKIFSSSNIYSLISGSGGSGTSRAIKIGTNVNGGNLAAPDTRTDWTPNNINSVVRATSTVSVGYNFSIFSNTASSGSFKALSLIATIAQTGTTDYTMLLINPSETTTGSGRKLLQDWQVGGSSKMVVTNAGWLGVLTQDPTHPLTFASAANTGIAIYNTADQVTNLERAVIRRVSNVLEVGVEKLNSGSNRATRMGVLTAGNNMTLTYQWGGTNGFTFTHNSASTPNIIYYSGTMNSSTGIQNGLNINPAINQSGTGGYTGIVVNPTITATGSGLQLLQDWQLGGTSLVVIDSTGKQGRLTTAPTNTDTHGSTSTGLALHNVIDQVTNYERARIQRSSNIFKIAVGAAGSGSSRSIRILVNTNGTDGDTNYAGIEVTSANVIYTMRASPSSTTGHSFVIGGSGSTLSSTVINFVSITPTFLHTGTAGYNALLINVTETSVGSGAKNLIVANLGGVTKFAVDRDGAIKIGNTVAVAAAVASTHKVTVDIGGTTYYLLATT